MLVGSLAEVGTSKEHYQQINEHENIKDGLTVTANHNLGNLGDSIESLGDLFDSEGNAISDASTGMRALDAINNSAPSASAHLGRTSITEKQTDTNSVAYGSKLNAQEDVNITAGETATVHGSEVNAKRNITIDANDINIAASENTADSKSKNGYHKTGLDLQGGKGNVSLTGGFTLSSSETINKDITANASQLNGENISLTAKNDINIKGSDVNATKNITLDAKNDINIVSAEEYTRSEFDSEYKSLNAGVNFGSDGIGVTANGSIGEEELDRKNITHRNSQVNAGEKLSITSGNDTTLKGANVSGKDVDVNVGNNLTIASEQNTGDVKGKRYDASFSVTVGAGVSASANLGYGETEGSSAWTANQTSLTGSNSINVNVKNHTQLDGAVLGNMTTDAEGNKTAGNNFNLTTKTFGFTDLKDHDKEKSTYVGVSIGGGSETKTMRDASVDSYGIDAQYSSHNKKQDTFATLGNGNITIENNIENGTDSLAGMNRDLTETQIITKDKSTNIDVYVQSDTIDMLANKDRRDHLVARMTDPSRLIGDSLGFMEIFDGMENALFTVAQGEIKAPTDEQLKGMTQEQRNAAWAEYKDKKENQGFINTSSAVEMDNSVKDFTVATRQNIIGVNHDGGLNLLSFGEGNNLIENYERLQDGRYNTLDGRANLSNQIQFTGQDGKNKDGVDILNNATLYSVDGNQAAMQYLVDGMTGRTDIDAALYSQTVKTGLPGEAKAVAINNNETNTHIVGVNIDKTDLQNQSDFITSIAEEARHSTNPDDHNANQYAAQAAYVWREENINEGRQTGQGVGINQWRADNKDDATIAKNNVTIGSQRARDMEFRQLQLPELKYIKDNARLYAAEQGDITEDQAKRELTQQALKMTDATWASQPHIQENETAREFLTRYTAGQEFEILTENGIENTGMFNPTESQFNNFKLGQHQGRLLDDPNVSSSLKITNEFNNWITEYGTANGIGFNLKSDIPSEIFKDTSGVATGISGYVDQHGWSTVPQLVSDMWNGGVDSVKETYNNFQTSGFHALIPDSYSTGSSLDNAYFANLIGDQQSFDGGMAGNAYGVASGLSAGSGASPFLITRNGLSDADSIFTSDKPLEGVGVKWGAGIDEQGYPWEYYIIDEQGLLKPEAKNFSTFDGFDFNCQLGVSCKTMDLNTDSKINNPNGIYYGLKRYIDKTANFDYERKLELEVFAKDVPNRTIELTVPANPTPSQIEQLKRAQDYAKSRGIILKITKVKD